MKNNHHGGKIPGLVPAKRDVYIENLSKYTTTQLWEIRDRQKKLLENKARLEKLPDKGERIEQLYQRVLKEIASQDEIDQAAEMFSDLNIASKGIKAMTNMEWSGGKSTEAPPQEVVDSDDDEEYADPIKLLAQTRGHVKLVKVETNVSLITAEDLKEVELFSKSSTENSTNDGEAEGVNALDSSIILDPHAMYVCGKDMAFKDTSDIKPKFKPYKTTIHGSHDLDKEKARKLGAHWEVTAATPPIIRNSETNILTMSESIEIQRKQFEHLKAVQEKQAMERLESRKKLVADNLDLLPAGSSTKDPMVFFDTYRDKPEAMESSDEYFSDNEDDGEEPEKGGVFY